MSYLANLLLELGLADVGSARVDDVHHLKVGETVVAEQDESAS